MDRIYEKNYEDANKLYLHANKLYMQGEKLITFKIFKPSKSTYYDAGELFNRSGDLFKVGKQLLKAAGAYAKSGENFVISGSENFSYAVNNFKNCGMMYLKLLSYNEAIKYFEIALKYCQTSKSLAIITKLLASVFQEQGDLQTANLHLLNVKEILSAEDNILSELDKLDTTIAQNYILQNDFPSAALIFELLVNRGLDRSLLKYQIPNYMFLQCLCILTHDIIGCQIKLSKYIEENAMARQNGKLHFVVKMIEALETTDNTEELFMQVVRDYDSTNALDTTELHLLKKIKSNISKDQIEL